MGMIRNVIIHIQNEQPLLADLYDMPGALDQGLLCTNLRMLDGKRPVFIDDITAVFFFPYVHVRFVEIPPRSLIGTDLEVPVEVAVLAGPAPSDEATEDEEDLEIDEDFLRRIREA